jgi:hypothetical protein
LSCDRFDKLINLFLDKRLNQNEERELKEHLARCPECKEKLSFLQRIEEKVKRIEAEEPTEEYWNTFSGRVREKILIQQEKSPTFGWKRFLDSLFSFSPLKIKVVAGVISVLFVFIIGKLYVDYRGGEILPWEKATKVQESSKSVVRDMGSEEEFTPAASEEGAESVPEKTETTKEEAVDRKGEIISPKKEDKGKTFPPESEEAPSSPVVTEEKIPPVSLPDVAIPEHAEAEAVDRIAISESKPTGAGVDQEAKKKRETTATIIKPAGFKDHDSLKVKGLDEILEAQLGFVSGQPLLQADTYELNGNSIPELGEADTSVPADTLKKVIQVWKTFIQNNPADSLSEEGYLQVANAYYLLSQTTQDTSYISESSLIITRYLDQVKDPSIEAALRDKLKKIQALRKK